MEDSFVACHMIWIILYPKYELFIGLLSIKAIKVTHMGIPRNISLKICFLQEKKREI